jgi:hypothetical protein
VSRKRNRFALDDVISIAFHHLGYAMSRNWTTALVVYAHHGHAVHEVVAGAGGDDLAAVGGWIAKPDDIFFISMLLLVVVQAR